MRARVNLRWLSSTILRAYRAEKSARAGATFCPAVSAAAGHNGIVICQSQLGRRFLRWQQQLYSTEATMGLCIGGEGRGGGGGKLYAPAPRSFNCSWLAAPASLYRVCCLISYWIFWRRVREGEEWTRGLCASAGAADTTGKNSLMLRENLCRTRCWHNEVDCGARSVCLLCQFWKGERIGDSRGFATRRWLNRRYSAFNEYNNENIPYYISISGMKLLK